MAKQFIKMFLIFNCSLHFSHSMFFAIYSVFLEKHNMNMLEINIPNIYFMTSMVILEMPTGSFADIFGRKKSMLVGCWLWSFSMLTYYVFHFFPQYFCLCAIAEIIAAFGNTFLTGATEAWIKDSLKHYKFSGSSREVFQKKAVWEQISKIGCVLIGAHVGRYDIALPWLLGTIGGIITAIIGQLILREDYRSENQAGKFRTWRELAKNFWNLFLMTIRVSLSYGWRNKAIWNMMLFFAVLSLSVQGFNMQWPLVFRNIFQLEVDFLGWIFLGVPLALLFGGKMSVWFSEKFHSLGKSIIVSQLITASGMIVASWILNFPLTLIAFYLHELGRGIIEPLGQDYFNNEILEDRTRATILSFQSMIARIGSIIGLLLSGYLAQNYSISISWMVSGIILLMGLPIFLRLTRK